MTTFKDLDYPEQLIHALNKQNITAPTDIQIQTYKNIYNNKDIIACSKTGSGKTLAYLMPMIARLDENNKNVQNLILVPTQELAVQVSAQAELVFNNANLPFKALFIIGEGNINRQIESLKNKPCIVIGTPSRVLQLIQMKKLRVHDVKTLVIDEADKLMDKTYYNDVLAIRRSLLKYTQVLLFSASINSKTKTTADSLTFKPIVVDVKQTDESLIPSTIKHYFIIADRRERIETLRKLAKALNSDKTMIFINTKYDLAEALQKLEFHHYSVGSLSSNSNKIDKKNTLDRFKDGRLKYLIATDVAARGLQIDQVQTVINVELPEEPTEYLHRAGRCGRNGNEGICISIITENELNKIKKYQKDFKINILQKRLYQGKLVAK
jgi:superfamily II DNA/RNA helicase